MSNDNGEVKESTLTVGDITVKASKIPAPVLSNADGEVMESALTVDDVRLLRLKNSRNRKFYKQPTASAENVHEGQIQHSAHNFYI